MPQTRDVDGIKVNKFFSGLKESVVAAIFNSKDFVEVAEGNILYNTGEESEQVFLILNGEIKINYADTSISSSKFTNDFFGEKEMLDGITRISSAIVEKTSLIYKIDKTIVMGLIAKYPIIKSNITQFGESKITDSVLTSKRKIIDFTKTSKPISFSPIRKKSPAIEQKKDEEEYSVPVTTEIPEPPDIEIPKPEPIPQNDNKNLKDDIKEKIAKSDKWKFLQVSPNKSIESFKLKEEPEPLPEPESEVIEKEETETWEPAEKTEKVFSNENFKKILVCIELMNSGITLAQTIKLISKSLKDLTVSEAVEVCLVDEKQSVIHKFNFEEDSYFVEQHNLSEGLTGACATEKKIINFDRPTEDKRFRSKLDQPGNSRLKRILFFPIVNSFGNTLAVIQLAREIKKFDEDDIVNLNLLLKQIETMLERSFELEQLLQTQQLNEEKIVQKLIISDEHPTIKIINSYIELLNDKKLPTDVEEVLRMLLKQVNSVEDVIRSIFTATRNELALEVKDVQFNEFIDDILELLSEYCESREVKLYKKIGDGAVVKIDRGKFYTAILQLIKFACNNSKQDGRIYFSTDRVDDKIEMQIKDEGKGIDEELQNRLLKQPPEAKSETIDSFGLMVAKKIIESHYGTITLESKKHEGTTILITLNTSGV